ncbi:Alpha/Beta hydrolase protein [Microdochium bolleyi]|uniref:Alpha/Beta hydrolase protein n=1 Tax=Microdochium bolleyi TaxID=196109 RepID=A0A136IK73_9PEZI|nr:Alpha/Beta hydrolase protein [Microdochium bolleyi]
MIVSLARECRRWFRPAIDAVFGRDMPWACRWRLLAIQPLVLLTTAIHTLPYLWPTTRPFTVEYITVDTGSTLRVLVYVPSPRKDTTTATPAPLRPLHLDIHGGAFIGGNPEEGAAFCSRVARETGAVVVSPTYRYAPRHCFPAAADDIDAFVRYLHGHAADRWAADPQLLTLSGWSAGGNLALAAAQQESCHEPAGTAFKGAVLFYAALDLNRSPGEKPKPEGMGGKDPMAWLYPLFDSYASRARAAHTTDPRFSPFQARLRTLPRHMLFVVPHIDLLVQEQLLFTDRVRHEIGSSSQNDHGHSPARTTDVLYVEHPKAFHGYLNCKWYSTCIVP